jgi:hypothetical protein
MIFDLINVSVLHFTPEDVSFCMETDPNLENENKHSLYSMGKPFLL